MWTGMRTPQRPLLLGMLGVGSALPCELSSHSACYTHSVSPIPLLHVACMRGLGWLCLSLRGEGDAVRVPQATFLSLTNKGGRPWVVTDTGFQ